MGNWRRVEIEGSIPSDDVVKIRDLFFVTYDDYEASDNRADCLGICDSISICGLNDWVAPSISVVGNLSERDYDVDDVKSALQLLGENSAGAKIKIHCGGDFESSECIATVILENGKVAVLDPEKETIPEISDSVMQKNLLAALFKPSTHD